MTETGQKIVGQSVYYYYIFCVVFAIELLDTVVFDPKYMFIVHWLLVCCCQL